MNEPCAVGHSVHASPERLCDMLEHERSQLLSAQAREVELVEALKYYCGPDGTEGTEQARKVLSGSRSASISEDKRMFPMLDEPRSIPWAIGKAIWETLYNPVYQGQSAERIAERGGFGWDEVKLMARKWMAKAALAKKAAGGQ